MRHYLSVDPTPLSKKPSHNRVGLIKSRFTDAEVDSVQDFIDVVEQGYSWSGATFKQNHLTNSNFLQSSVLGLDFDQGLTPKEAQKRLEKYDLSPSCWYPSFSDDPQGKRKFRLVFFLDTPITDKGAHRALINLLLKCYPEADKSARDPARFFYGSKSPGVVLNPEEIPLDDFYTVLSSNAVAGKPLQQNGRKTKGGKALQNITAVASSTIINSSECHESKMARRRYEWLKKNLRSKNVDWEKLAERVEIFDQFLNGDKRLKYSQLEGIATNLAWMRGGSAIYRKRLEEFNEQHLAAGGNDPYPIDGRQELLRDFRQRNKQFETCMFPMNLDNDKFMAPKEDHRYKNLIQAERDQVKGVKIKVPIERMTLPKAEQLFQYKFNQVMDSWGTDIHIFKTHTALGKTQAIKDAGSNTLLCFPTHDLKDEVWERRRDKRNCVVTPKLPVFESMSLNNKLAKLYELGFNAKAHKEIVGVWKGFTDEDYSVYDQRLAEDYIRKKREIYVTDKTILTTHDWAIHAIDKLKQIDTVVFDEDCRDSLAPVDSVKISDLTKMASNSGETLFRWKGQTLMDVVEYLISDVQEGEITELPEKFDLNPEDHATSYSLVEGLSSNVVDFLQADFIYREKGNPDTVHFINQSYLPNDRKVVILSASASVNFFKEIYGSRVQVHDISDIHKKGTVEQDLSKSFSRVSLKNSIEEANEKTSEAPTITFMTERENIDTAVDDIYFGNCSGYDDLKGVPKLNILGTPHIHNSKTMLLGAVLGIPLKHEKNREFGRKNVQYGGMEFNFSTFVNNERLSQIQMELIHSELIQAVGRARALREEDTTVTVYSNFPLRIAAPNFKY